MFGFGQWEPFAQIQQGNQPALHHCVAQILRTIMMLVMMCIDFPAAPIRPMGLGVLRSELLVPVKTCIEACTESLQDTVRNFTLNNHSSGGGVLEDVCPMGSSAYKALLQLMVVFGLPMYIGGMMVLLLSPSFRTGEPNSALNDNLTDMFCDVVQFITEDSVGDDDEYHNITGEVPTDSL